MLDKDISALQTAIKNRQKSDFLQHAPNTHPKTNISDKSETKSTNENPNENLYHQLDFL